MSSLISSAIKLQSARMFARVLVAVSGLIVARNLGPVTLGMLTFPMLLVTYASHYNFGISGALTREIPVLAGENDNAGIIRIKRLSSSALIILAMLIVFTCYITRLIFPGFITIDNVLFHLTIAGIILTMLGGFLYTLVIANQSFNVASLSISFQSIVRITTVIVVLYALSFIDKLYAQPVGLLISLTVFSAILMKSARFRFGWSFNLQNLVRLISTGLAISLYAFLLSLLSTGDTFILQHVLDQKMIGFYQLGNMLRDTMIMIGGSSAAVLIPQYGRLYGASGHRNVLQRKFFTHSFYFALCIPLILATIYYFLPLIIKLLLPEFIGAIDQLQLLTLSIGTLVLIHIPGSFLIVISKQKQLCVLLSLAFLALLVSNYLFVADSGSANISPLINGIIYGLTALALFQYAAYHYWKKTRQQAKQLVFLVPLLLGSILPLFISIDTASHVTTPLYSMLVFLFVYLPVALIFYGIRDRNLVESFDSVIQSWRKG
jgi:O-antigen/teichoic acid export membrane protein